ncbi:NAD-dependent SIR2 family protein deacetylase [Salsuginibacillus halophilus]|uniref:protein acetyllysine N-acetyltransferase n=1 Tax=Salsuginibacillus halophilus TaxID=517424 RepID=A0A2P8H929_9BACI|nr:NAD-dependent SIR2 family protein deacetylase [Salsuginibacillus halophilus]
MTTEIWLVTEGEHTKATVYGPVGMPDFPEFVWKQDDERVHIDGWNELYQLLCTKNPVGLTPAYVDERLVEVLKHWLLTEAEGEDSELRMWIDQIVDTDPDEVMAARWICRARHVMVVTGAGMSTESNLPDFRSKDGWWRNIDPVTVATVEALEKQYELFHAFYQARLEALYEAEPHQGHNILAKWEEVGVVSGIATQNVDGLHTAAGSEQVHELHGSIHSIRCYSCGQEAELHAFHEGRGCDSCDGKLRPGVVLFGEMLPQKAWDEALKQIEQADVVLVIGTSLEVYPANQLPWMTRGRTVYMNMELNADASAFDAVITGKAKEVLTKLDKKLELYCANN